VPSPTSPRVELSAKTPHHPNSGMSFLSPRRALTAEPPRQLTCDRQTRGIGPPSPTVGSIAAPNFIRVFGVFPFVAGEPDT
jgi:hypothetical protein